MNALISLDEALQIVIVARYVVAASEIHPSQPSDVLSVKFLEGAQNSFKHIGILLAHCMEVEPVHHVFVLWEFLGEYLMGYSQPRIGCAWVVHLRGDLGVTRIHSHAYFHAIFPCHFPVFLELDKTN